MTIPDHGENPWLDLALVPLSYPGPRAVGSMLVLPDGEQHQRGRPLDTLHRELRRRGLAPLEARVPVAAVGSNASPAVLRTKLTRAGVSPVVPLMPGAVQNLRIGISAHVSRPGFIPAAPARVNAVAGSASVVVGWFDPEQLGHLDDTEPNYTRIRLSATDFPIQLEDGAGIECFDVYDSHWGVLAGPDGLMPLPTQTELCLMLAAFGLEPWRARSPVEAVRALAASQELRTRARNDLRHAGLVAESGLRSGRR